MARQKSCWPTWRYQHQTWREEPAGETSIDQEKNLWTPRKWKTSGQQERNARDNYQFSFPRLRVVPQGHAEGFTWWWFKSLLASHEFDGVRKEKERLTAAQLLHHESFFWSSSSFSWWHQSCFQITGLSSHLVTGLKDAGCENTGWSSSSCQEREIRFSHGKTRKRKMKRKTTTPKKKTRKKKTKGKMKEM